MEQNSVEYMRVGDYFISDLVLPTKEQKPIGRWGQRHLRYIKHNKKGLYLELKATAKLNAYLADSFSRLVKGLTEKESVTEELKASNQMEWVQRMNNIRERVVEFANHQIIFT